MGYRIEIDEFVLRQLRNSPAEVFSKPYSGYLLFLAGAADKDVTDWMAKSVIALDSLTGEDIAFGIFAWSLRAEIRAPDSIKRPNSQPPKVIEVALGDLADTRQSVNSLLLSGRYGDIFDGDEINAITYASDEIARRFEVLNELPCIIILDALPRNNIEVFRLTAQNVDSLIGLLRRSIQNLRQQRDYPEFVKALRRLVMLQKHLSATRKQISLFQSQRDRIKHEDYLVVSQTLLHRFREALLFGKVKQFYSILNRHEVKVFFDKSQIDRAKSMVQEEKINLQIYANAIHRLGQYATNYPWPLEESVYVKYSYFLLKTAFVLLPDLSTDSDLNDLSKCQTIQERLRTRQSELIDKALIALMEAKDTEGVANEIAKSERAKLESQIEEKRTSCKRIEKSIAKTIEEIYGFDEISFIRCFTNEARKDRMTTFTKRIRSAVSAYAGGWLQPGTLVEIGKTLTTP